VLAAALPPLSASLHLLPVPPPWQLLVLPPLPSPGHRCGRCPWRGPGHALRQPRSGLARARLRRCDPGRRRVEHAGRAKQRICAEICSHCWNCLSIRQHFCHAEKFIEQQWSCGLVRTFNMRKHHLFRCGSRPPAPTPRGPRRSACGTPEGRRSRWRALRRGV